MPFFQKGPQGADLVVMYVALLEVPLGDRYVFELSQNGQNIQRYWTTSCGTPKSYLGAQTLTISLFKAQVPVADPFLELFSPNTAPLSIESALESRIKLRTSSHRIAATRYAMKGTK